MSTVLLWFLHERLSVTAYVNDTNTVVINTIYRHVLSVLLAELHSYAYTDHCSQACVSGCIDCIMNESIEERLELSILLNLPKNQNSI